MPITLDLRRAFYFIFPVRGPCLIASQREHGNLRIGIDLSLPVYLYGTDIFSDVLFLSLIAFNIEVEFLKGK